MFCVSKSFHGILGKWTKNKSPNRATISPLHFSYPTMPQPVDTAAPRLPPGVLSRVSTPETPPSPKLEAAISLDGFEGSHWFGVDGTQFTGEPIWENPNSQLNRAKANAVGVANGSVGANGAPEAANGNGPSTLSRTPSPPAQDPPHVGPDYLQMILTAPVYEVAQESPLTHAVNLSTRFGNDLFLKREDLQPVFSFKLRGAYNRMAQLTDEEKKRGVICASAGNHAQGVALSAKKMGIEATIVMPLATPPIKVKNVERLGGKAVLYGMDFDEAKKKRQQLIDVGYLWQALCHHPLTLN